MLPSLNYAVLTDALHALKEGNIHHCESLGFTYNELSMDELFILSRASASFLRNVPVNSHFQNFSAM